MRTLTKLGVTGIATLVLLFAIGVLWFYHYSHDLPDISARSRYAPATVAQVSDGCLGQSVAIPYDSIGRNLRSALNAAEVRENDPGVLTTTYQAFTGHNRPCRATSSFQTAQYLFQEDPTELDVGQASLLAGTL